ncbi:MAG: pentapeptide repeat-containing protein [Candidatus Shapirobacteria bacterium]|jgi:uncharacterized protein YjbI with pentapeptide repeats
MLTSLRNYQGEEIEKERLQSVNFSEVNLKFSSFSNCVLVSCNFTGAQLDQTLFTNCKFSGCCLSGVDFSEISIKKCRFIDTLLSYSTFQKFKAGSKYELVTTDLSSNTFEGTDLSNSVFNNCLLRKVKFEKTKLLNAVFKNCDLSEADLISANIEGAIFSQCQIFQTKLSLDGLIKFGGGQGFVLES